MRTRKHKAHIALILFISLVWLILSADAVALAASDWFVRPAGGNYGAEDGSSYEDAWDGLQSVVWGSSGVEAGDNLYVCGLHLWPETAPTQVARNWVIGASGTDDDTRITIRGDYLGDQGIIWGVQNLSGAGTVWVDEGDNTYSSTSENYGGFFFEDVTATSWTILTRVNSIQECKDTPGSYYSPTFSYPDPLYVHCSDGDDPTGRIVAGANGWYIVLTNCQYITFKNIEFYVPMFLGAKTYIRWEGCKLWYKMLLFRDGSHHIELIDCDIAHGKCGLGIQDTGDDIPNNITVRGCYIHDIGIYPIKQNSDAEGIGINGCNNLTIENNEFYNCGNSITTYPYVGQTSTNLIIRWNYIHDSHQLGGANGGGIQLNMHPPNTQDKSGCQVYGNIVTNIQDDAYASKWATDQIVFYNNVAYNCGGSFFFNYTYTDYLGPNIVLRNNISINPTTYHIYFGSSTNEGNYTIDSDYNLFYPDKPDGFAFKESGYATYPDLSGWQALSRTGCTFDPHSIAADPLFVDPENGNFHLWSNSPAINAGVDVGFTEDIEGNPIPQGPAPDIGAYEYVLDPNNQAPVLQTIGNKSVNENSALTFDVNATDADGDAITYTATGPAIDAGATFSGQTFSWTPNYSQAGSYEVTFRATDGKTWDSEKITITVNNVNRPPNISGIPNTLTKQEGQTITTTEIELATDPEGETLTYTYSNWLTSLPYTTTYDDAGTHTLHVDVSDGTDTTGKDITITVNNVNRATDISSIPSTLIKYVSGTITTAEIELAQDPDGDTLTYTYSGWLTSLPYTITSGDVGTHTLHVDVSDGTDTTGKNITITVDVDNQAPNVTNCKPIAGSVQVPVNNLISLHITDAGIGIDANSVTIKVNNDTVYTGDVADNNSTYGLCQRTGTKVDYMFHYKSHEVFNYDQTVTVTVNATDLAGNVMDEYSSSFQTYMRSFGDNKKVNPNTLSSNSMPVTVRDSSGNIWTAWHTGVTGSRDIYISKLAVGADNFGNSINLLTNSSADQCNPAIAVDADDKLYVVWQDNRQGSWDIYVSTSSDGTNWSAETPVTDANDDQTNPVIVVDGSNKAYVAWQDDRNGNEDIYTASSSNDFPTSTSGTRITSDDSDQTEPAIAVDYDNIVYVVWTDARGSSNDIYGAASNSGTWTNAAIVNNANNQSNPAIATESEGSILHMVWVDDTHGDNDIFYVKTSGGLPGSHLTGYSIIDTPGANQSDPVIAVTGRTNNSLKVFACWRDERWLSSSGDTDIFFDEITSSSGTDIFVGDDGTNTDQIDPAIGIDGDGDPYLVWTDSRNTNTDIYYAGNTSVDSTVLASSNISISSTINVQTANGVSVVVPAGAYPCDIKITISGIKNPPKTSKEYLSLPYDFGPSGIEFDQPVTITIPYEALSSNYSTSAYWYNLLTASSSQQGITDIETIGTSPTYLRFKTTHFTQFFVGGSIGSSSSGGGGGGGGGGCSMSPNSQASAAELLLPYIGLTVAMVALKLRDRRKRKARNIT